MNYADIRRSLKTGDLVAWCADGDWTSRHGIETHLEKPAQEDKWTHVGIIWSEHGRVFVMDLTTHGCAPRPLSSELPCYVVPAPRRLSEDSLQAAFARFGKMTYSRWQGVKAWLRNLVIGADAKGQCAEFALEIYRVDGIAPTDIALPGTLVDAAMDRWDAPLIKVTA